MLEQLLCVWFIPEPPLEHPLLQTQFVPMENVSLVNKSSLFPGTQLRETLWQMCLQNLGFWSLEIMFPLSVAAGVAKLSTEDLARALGSSFACLALTKSQE